MSIISGDFANVCASNFAGISGGAVMTLDANGPDFEKVMAVNATGVMLCTKHQMRQMIKQEPLSSYVLVEYGTWSITHNYSGMVQHHREVQL